MTLTCIEILNPEDGTIFIAEGEGEKGCVKIKKSMEACLGSPLGEIKSKELKKLFRRNGFRGKNIIIILPEGADNSVIWTSYAKEKQRKNNDAQTQLSEAIGGSDDADENITKISCLGETDSISYGLISAVPADMPGILCKAFKGFNVMHIMPRLAAFSLIRQSSAGNTAVMDIKDDKLTFAVYSGKILIWLNDFPYSQMPQNEGAKKAVITKTAKEAIAAARNKYLYPAKIYLLGSVPISLASLSDTLETDCESLNDSLAACVLKSGRISTTINFKPPHMAANQYLKIASLVLLIMTAVSVFAPAKDYISDSITINRLTESESDSGKALQDNLSVLNRENEINGHILEILEQKEPSASLDSILETAANIPGINILTIDKSRITGYGQGLNEVTRFIKELNAKTETEADVKDILQISINQNIVTGFDLELGGAAY